MEEERIKAIKNWPKPQSIRNISMFLSFANFYRTFIQNFSKIIAPFTLMLQITDNKILSTQVVKNEKNQKVSSGITRTGSSKVSGNFENLSIVAELAKSKKLKLTNKSKKPKLTKSKKSDLTKANFLEMDFLTFGAKKAFIYL